MIKTEIKASIKSDYFFIEATQNISTDAGLVLTVSELPLS